jgi:hypothetical protein
MQTGIQQIIIDPNELIRRPLHIFLIAKKTITSNPKYEMPATENTIFSKRLRRMLGLSLHNWENVMLIFLGVAAIAAVFVGISTYAVVRLQKVESEYARKSLEEYKLEAGGKISEANARAAEANLEIERLKAPRSLSAEQQARIRDKVKDFHGTTFDITTYPWETEPAAFSRDISKTLEEAAWAFNPNKSRTVLVSLVSRREDLRRYASNLQCGRSRKSPVRGAYL